MNQSRAVILDELRQKILPLQGYRPLGPDHAVDIDLGPMNNCFPNGCFPVGAVHEFISSDTEQLAATHGFIAGLLSSFMKNGRVSVWISPSATVFPPALKTFNIEPDHILFIDVKKEKDILWVMEETLKCGGLAAVIGEIPNINFTASRRLQLAVEQSGVTGFILRRHPHEFNTIASVSRWKITSIPSAFEDGMPGVGFPRWNVELLKVRNGKTGIGQFEWSLSKFQSIPSLAAIIPQEEKRKTG